MSASAGRNLKVSHFGTLAAILPSMKAAFLFVFAMFSTFSHAESPCLSDYREAYSNAAKIEEGRATLPEIIKEKLSHRLKDAQSLYEIYVDSKNGIANPSPDIQILTQISGARSQQEALAE